MTSKWRKLLAALALLAFAAGCAAMQEQPAEPIYESQLTLYLNGPDKAEKDITVELGAVSLVAEDGSSVTVAGPISINSRAVEGGQMLLGEKYVPEGKYVALRLDIKGASLRSGERTASLALEHESVELPVEAELKSMRTTTLFLLWDADESLVGGYQLSLSFGVAGVVPQPTNLHVFVTNEGSGNVSVINRQTGKVVAAIMAGKRPRGVATSLVRDRQRVYVANYGSGSVSVIDPAAYAAESEIPVRFGRQPEDIVVAKMTDSSELVVVANHGSNTVSLIDATSFHEVDSARVGIGPVAVAADPPVENFLNSRFLSFEQVEFWRRYLDRFINIYVLNRDSRDLTVLRLDRQTGKFDTDAPLSISVQWNPSSVSMDPQRAKLYITNHDTTTLSVVDILKVIAGDAAGAVSEINDVGLTCTDVAADPALDRLYLLKEVPGEMNIIRFHSGELGAERTGIAPVLGWTGVGEMPRSIVLDPEARKLFVVNRASNDVYIIDKISKGVERVVPVGLNPYGIAMFPQF